MNKGWLAVLLLGVAGSVALWRLLPGHDPLVRERVSLDRYQAIARTRHYARLWGCPVQQGTPLVFTEQNPAFVAWLASVPGAAEMGFPQPFFHVEIRGSTGKAVAEYAADGRLTLFQCSAKRTGAVAGGGNSADLASGVFRELAGSAGPRFRPQSVAPGEQGGQHYAWDLTDNPPGAKWSITADVQGQAVRRAELTYWIDDSVVQRYKARSGRGMVMVTTGSFVVYLIILAAPILCIIAAVRRRLQVRFTLTVWALFFLVTLPPVWQGIMGKADDGDAVPPSLMRLYVASGVLLEAAMFAGVLGLGDLLSGRHERLRWRPFHLLVRGRWHSRPVGTSLLAGLAAAPGLAAVTVVLMSSGLFPAMIPGIGGRARQPYSEAWPALFALLPNVQDTAIVVFGLLAAWLAGRRRWGTAAWVVLSLLAYASDGAPSAGPAGVLVWAALQLAGATLVYRYFGLLAVLVASIGSDRLVSGVRLAHAVSPVLHTAGLRVLAVFGTAALVGLVVSRRGRVVSESDQAPVVIADVPELNEREQLKSEFSVAHRAQQQMLPTQSPRLPGIELAGLCQPARDVGGDLYDYVRLADGRHGICVADVSGKGMPAALYMTFTKGLLTAAAQDSGDLATIAKQLNAHLYIAGRRKVFVTAVLGVLDAETRQFEYVRAGHNPVVWRRCGSKETRMLQASGMGLGVGASRFFDRCLKSEQLLLEPGDALVFYSDGVTEAMNESLEQFGEDRLMDCVSQTDGLDAATTRDKILATVQQFLDGVHPQDDITIVVLRVEGGLC